ncbi:MAG: AMP-binding protein, partial [Hyphomicrobiales bacterium]
MAVDTFANDNLPPRDQWPEFDLSHPAYQYPERLNCVTRFVDRWIDEGKGGRTAFITPEAQLTYGDVADQVNQLARVLIDDFGMSPGNRVLLRAANTPMMVIAYMAVIKAGGIAVGTMPLLRAKELAVIAEKAEIALALCDERLKDELVEAQRQAPVLKQIGWFHSDAPGSVESLMAPKPTAFTAFDSGRDDVCLIAFTSGTTGMPKGTMHFHRDMLAICDGFSAHVLKPDADDIFCGSPPLAFTFGLGGLALFSMHVGAASLLLEAAPPDALMAAIEKHRATVCFTAPTAYRAMIGKVGDHDLSSLKKAVSAGEHLPRATFEAVRDTMGLSLIDGLGATEMLHIFITSAGDRIRVGATGVPVPGYRACILDDDGREVPHGTPGNLAVKGPTGCRYLADDRQTEYVRGGWNLTGDTMIEDEDGYFWYQARSDDMIISAGYNISGPEVENALLTHDAVAECGVIGKPDETRGQIVKAFVVLAEGSAPGDAMVGTLQDHVKQTVAPYKYPREVSFVAKLPRTQTGKLQ